MKQKRIYLAILFFFFFTQSFGFCFNAIELFSGWMSAALKDKEHYQGVPFLASFGFKARPVLEKVNLPVDENFNFVVEPFATFISSPNSNIEVGSNFLIKYLIPLSEKIRLYVKGGIGVLYMSQHTKEQATQINFLPQIGVGVHYFLDTSTALSMEYRYRHLSNGSIKHPNKGIDANIVLVGISFFY